MYDLLLSHYKPMIEAIATSPKIFIAAINVRCRYDSSYISYVRHKTFRSRMNPLSRALLREPGAPWRWRATSA